MKLFIPTVLFLIAFGAQAQVVNTPAKSWYKGNLHTHSYWSDGDDFPEMIVDWYKTHGYQFIALSDHNTLQEGEKWKLITKSKTYLDGFDKYLTRFGNKWVVYKQDTGRISVRLKTLKEYRPLFEDRNFLIIQSEEVTDKFGDKHVHMNATNVQSVIPAQGGNSVQEVIQRNLDAIIKQRKETGVPIMQHLNHPNFFYSVTTQNIIDLNGERFFEVYNGHHLVHNYGDSLHPGTERMWDEINVAYIKQGKPMLFGLASDDSHNYHLFGPNESNAGRGWVMVRSAELTPAALITSMEAGDFYASTGIVLRELFVKNNFMHIEVEPERDVYYNIDFIGVRKNETKSTVLASFPGPKGQFEITNEYLFVRAKVTSSKKRTNPLAEDENETAWIQPVSVK
jgi:hypothetical protein